MPYTLYQEQGGISASLVSPTISGTPVITTGAGSVFQSSACLATPFFPPFASTTATVHVTDVTYYSYLGRVNTAKTSCKVQYYLKTSITATVTYAEMAIYIGTPLPGAVPDALTLAGYLDCSGSGQFGHAPGALTATIPLSGVVGGSDLWLATASKTSGQCAEFEGLMLDRFGSGLFAFSKASAQPSITTTLAASDLTIGAAVGSAAVLVYI